MRDRGRMDPNAVDLQSLLRRELALVSAALVTWPQLADVQPRPELPWDTLLPLEVELLGLEILWDPPMLAELTCWRRALRMLIATPSDASSVRGGD